jgi:hypothetical protein
LPRVSTLEERIARVAKTVRETILVFISDLLLNRVFIIAPITYSAEKTNASL